VQSIIRELRGEKIDIIEFSEDPVVFATHALSPAKITRVAIVSNADRHMEVIVDDSQLSLAIGKKGQNVRLASKLLGWRIDIKSEEEKRQEVESAMAALVVPGAPVSVLIDHGLNDAIADRLLEAGVSTVEKLGNMTPEELEEIQGIGPKMVERILIAVNSYYAQFEPGAGEAAAAAAQDISPEEISTEDEPEILGEPEEPPGGPIDQESPRLQSPEEVLEPAKAGESDTIKDAD
jgi:transcription termination/antitermination protein NusA